MTDLIKHKHCHGTIGRAEVLAIADELSMNLTGEYTYGEIIHRAEQIAEERHLARVAKSPHDFLSTPGCHPFACECHWCCHDEEFDDNPEECPACQEVIYVLKASADWSKCWLVSDTIKGILNTIEPDLEEMLNHPEDDGTISIHVEKMTNLEWQLFLLEGHEFEGFQ